MSVKKGETIIMIEPWVSFWSRIIFDKLHYEPFVTASPSWSFPQNGPLSGANIALPWIIFQRDRERFNYLTN